MNNLSLHLLIKASKAKKDSLECGRDMPQMPGSCSGLGSFQCFSFINIPPVPISGNKKDTLHAQLIATLWIIGDGKTTFLHENALYTAPNLQNQSLDRLQVAGYNNYAKMRMRGQGTNTESPRWIHKFGASSDKWGRLMATVQGGF